MKGNGSAEAPADSGSGRAVQSAKPHFILHWHWTANVSGKHEITVTANDAGKGTDAPYTLKVKGKQPKPTVNYEPRPRNVAGPETAPRRAARGTA